ncbi:MAG: isochorismatase family protein [Phocaeicola sp.]
MNRLLLIVDPQVDFITGTLPVPHATHAMNELAHYVSEATPPYTHIVVTADRHPANHCSFTENGGIWPTHCVHSSSGAAIWQPLMEALHFYNRSVTFLYKGEDKETEEYSIFANPLATATISEIIKNNSIEQIEVCGIAGDICVADTICDGMKLFGQLKINILTRFSPSLDGGKRLDELISKLETVCDR